MATAAAGLPILGYYLSPFLRRPEDEWVDIGAVGDFPAGQTRMVTYKNPRTNPWDGDAAKAAAYVRNEGNDNFTIFAVNCTHLGCPVSWFPQSGLFLCPCHGGVYYADGSRASGPPPRGLYTYEFEVKAGRLRIKAGHLPTLQDTLNKNEASA
jgi:Rieske Fe-S protein